MIDVKCSSTHREDLADGRSLIPGEVARDVDETHPHNRALLDEQRLIALPTRSSFDVAKTNVEQVLAHVGEDPVRAATVLEVERARGKKARRTLIDRLQAIATPHEEDQPS